MMLGAALTAASRPSRSRDRLSGCRLRGHGEGFDFIHATNDVLTEREIQLPLEGQSTTTPESRAERASLYRRRSSGPTSSTRCTRPASEDEIHFQRLLSANCFGDNYTGQE